MPCMPLCFCQVFALGRNSGIAVMLVFVRKSRGGVSSFVVFRDVLSSGYKVALKSPSTRVVLSGYFVLMSAMYV